MQHSQFSKINKPGGLLLHFSRRDVQNTENESFLCLEIAKTDRRGHVRVGENGSGHEIPFLWLNSFFRGKYRNLITSFLLVGDISVT